MQSPAVAVPGVAGAAFGAAVPFSPQPSSGAAMYPQPGAVVCLQLSPGCACASDVRLCRREAAVVLRTFCVARVLCCAPQTWAPGGVQYPAPPVVPVVPSGVTGASFGAQRQPAAVQAPVQVRPSDCALPCALTVFALLFSHHNHGLCVSVCVCARARLMDRLGCHWDLLPKPGRATPVEVEVHPLASQWCLARWHSRYGYGLA
jgi:hypothetical protein